MVHGVLRSRQWRVALRVLTVTFLVLAALPWLTVLFAKFHATFAVSEILRDLYGFQCHQRTSRSLVWLGVSLPVCARCTGIYFGLGFAVLVRRPQVRLDPLKAWLLLGALFLALDVATESVGLRPASALFRFATGAFLSYGIALLLVRALMPSGITGR
jgi:uncharacterized membrane protein